MKVNNNSYRVGYDDGEEEDNVPESRIRSKAAATSISENAAIPKTTSKAPTSSSNLESFLNDLSDDEDDGGFGGLDAGNPVAINSKDASFVPVGNQDDYDEDFAA